MDSLGAMVPPRRGHAATPQRAACPASIEASAMAIRVRV